MDFGELRMDSGDLLDLLGGDGSPDNNNSLPFDGLDLSFMDHLGDPNPVKEEPVELTTGLTPSSDDVASPADQDYHMDMPADGGLSTADEDPEPSGAAMVLPVVTTGEASGRKASTRAAAASQQKKSKRSRRVRTPKQQELNRLAQQRYRERKKQKYSSLQQAVDALSEQLEKVAVVEEERDNLQAENDDLQEQLKGQAAKLHARDNVIKQQQKQLDAQQAEIAQLKQRLGALTSAESSTDVRLLQQLASAVKTAFEENDCSSAQMVLNQFPEMLMEHISKTVRQCCRELNAEAATPKPIPQVVQVSCC